MPSIPCAQVPPLTGHLLAGEIDAADLEVLDEHLARCGSCRAEAAASLRLHRALGEMAAERQLGELLPRIQESLNQSGIPGARPPAPSNRAAGLSKGLVGAAAGLLLAVGLLLWTSATPPAIARIERVEGEVYRVREGRETGAVVAGQDLRSGEGLKTVGEISSAVVMFADGSRIDLGPDSTVGELTAEKGKRVVLLGGLVGAEVCRQPEGRPMVIATPDAEVIVQGTRLSLSRSHQATRVELHEGAVRCLRKSDGYSVALTAGTSSVIRVAPEAVVSQPLPPPITSPRVMLPSRSSRVYGLKFDREGRSLLAVSDSGVKLWPYFPAAGQEPRMLYRHDRSGHVRSIAVAPSGDSFVTGGDDTQVRSWDFGIGEELEPLGMPIEWVGTLSFSPDGRTLAVASAHSYAGDKVYLVDLDSRRVRAAWRGHSGGVWAVAFSPDGRTLASTGRDGVVKLWDVADGQVRHALEGHVGEGLCLAFSPDGTTLASGGRDKSVLLWDVASGREIRRLVGHLHDVRAVAFSPDGGTLASGSIDATVRLWRVPDGRGRAVFRGDPGGIWAVAFSPDGRILVSGGMSKQVRLWDVPAE